MKKKKNKNKTTQFGPKKAPQKFLHFLSGSLTKANLSTTKQLQASYEKRVEISP